jgi:hypothetical protein
VKLAIKNLDAKRKAPEYRNGPDSGDEWQGSNPRRLRAAHPPTALPGIPLLVLVVVERLPETNPNIEQAQAAAEATEEAIGDHRAESGK